MAELTDEQLEGLEALATDCSEDNYVRVQPWALAELVRIYRAVKAIGALDLLEKRKG